jgi:hypothetical protein
MPRRNPYGRITPQRARELAASLPPSAAPVLNLLTDPAERVAAAGPHGHLWPQPPDDDELPPEMAALFGPTGNRVQASSRPLTDDECYDLLFGED